MKLQENKFIQAVFSKHGCIIFLLLANLLFIQVLRDELDRNRYYTMRNYSKIGDLTSTVDSIESYVSDIESDVSDIERYVKYLQ